MPKKALDRRVVQPQCAADTKAGERCKQYAAAGDDRCSMHSARRTVIPRCDEHVPRSATGSCKRPAMPNSSKCAAHAGGMRPAARSRAEPKPPAPSGEDGFESRLAEYDEKVDDDTELEAEENAKAQAKAAAAKAAADKAAAAKAAADKAAAAKVAADKAAADKAAKTKAPAAAPKAGEPAPNQQEKRVPYYNYRTGQYE